MYHCVRGSTNTKIGHSIWDTQYYDIHCEYSRAPASSQLLEYIQYIILTILHRGENKKRIPKT